MLNLIRPSFPIRWSHTIARVLPETTTLSHLAANGETPSSTPIDIYKRWSVSESTAIYEAAINEMYTFCRENSLISLWSYLWVEWYNDRRWPLWARSACEEKISILKTTMFVEGHWKVIKRDFLYKIFRPCLDLVVYVTKFIPHQQRKLQQIISGRENPGWIKQLNSLLKSFSVLS